MCACTIQPVLLLLNHQGFIQDFLGGRRILHTKHTENFDPQDHVVMLKLQQLTSLQFQSQFYIFYKQSYIVHAFYRFNDSAGGEGSQGPPPLLYETLITYESLINMIVNSF